MSVTAKHKVRVTAGTLIAAAGLAIAAATFFWGRASAAISVISDRARIDSEFRSDINYLKERRSEDAERLSNIDHKLDRLIEHFLPKERP